MAQSAFAYVTYIRATPEKLWAALTDEKLITQWWFGTRAESQWTTGSSWRMVYPDGHVPDTGEIAEAVPSRRLVIRWQHQQVPEFKAEGESRCTIELESSGPAVRFSLTHTIEHESSKLVAALSNAWPMTISNLKSLLETGSPVLQERWPSDSAHVGSE
jgi:uncharacterized protein YndB with AHSA1/START domain